MTLGGTICIRNGIKQEYCFQEAIRSLLPVCDEIVVCDGESSDSTWDLLQDWASKEPKLKLCVYQWPHPVADVDFYVKWLNYAREHQRTDYHIHLDADEVLGEECYSEVEAFKLNTKPSNRVSLWCHRHNFWQDAQHMIPPGHCLSHRVVRVAPTGLWLPSDGAVGLAAQHGHAVISMAKPSGLTLYHYGFLRRKAAYFEKSRALHTMFFGGMTDPRMLDVEDKLGQWMEEIRDVPWTKQLVKFTGSHSACIRPWLTERGWLPTQ